jgi:hypothetical protein
MPDIRVADEMLDPDTLQSENLDPCLYSASPSYRRSLQSSKENIQHFKTWNF